MIDSEAKATGGEHVEHASSPSKVEDIKEPSPAASPTASITFEGVRQRGDSGESSDAVQDGKKKSEEHKSVVQVLEREHLHEATQ